MVQEALDRIVTYAQPYIDLVKQSHLTPQHKAYALLSVYRDLIIAAEGLGQTSLANRLLSEAQPFVGSFNGEFQALLDFYVSRSESAKSDGDIAVSDQQLKYVSELMRRFVSERPGLNLKTMNVYFSRRTKDLISAGLIIKHGDSKNARLVYYPSREDDLVQIIIGLIPASYTGTNNIKEVGSVTGVATGHETEDPQSDSRDNGKDRGLEGQDHHFALPASLELRVRGVRRR